MTASHDKVVTLYTLKAGGAGTGEGGVGGTGYEQVGGGTGGQIDRQLSSGCGFV